MTCITYDVKRQFLFHFGVTLINTITIWGSLTEVRYTVSKRSRNNFFDVTLPWFNLQSPVGSVIWVAILGAFIKILKSYETAE